MSQQKYEPGDRMPDYQEDFVSGSLEWQKQIALRSKKVRSYLIKHPGARVKDIRSGTGIKNVNECLNWLKRRNFARYDWQGGWIAIAI